MVGKRETLAKLFIANPEVAQVVLAALMATENSDMVCCQPLGSHQTRGMNSEVRWHFKAKD